MVQFKAKQDTYLKKTTKKQANQLPKEQKHFIGKGDIISVENYKIAPNNANYYIFNLMYGQGTWIAFKGHFGLVGQKQQQQSSAIKTEPQHKVTTDNLNPAYPVPYHTIDWRDMKSKIGIYFTLGENLIQQRERFPTSEKVKKNIYLITRELDRIREAWGGAIIINSGYRPLHVNRRIGSSDRSQHVQGTAVDIRPANGQGRKFEQWLDQGLWKNKALGFGQRAGRGFTHIDLRAGRIRWNY